MTRTPVIELQQVTRRFGDATALDNLSLTVDQGEILGLVGPDGAGKTTVLRMISGLMDPTSGQIRVAGFDVRRHPDAVKDRIGYMAQKFGLYGDLTVEENMRFWADLFAVTGRERQVRMARLLELTRLAPFRRRRAAQLSGGMKQKLALMCTLLHHPQVLLLDEPTNGVDPVSRRDFWAILNELVQEGLTVLLTTAYLDEAERCSRVALMAGGRLLRLGTPRALRESVEDACYEVRALDLGQARRALAQAPGVLSVDLAGSALHVMASAGVSQQQLRQWAPEAEIRPILPTLEDVLIYNVRRGAGRA